jgi:formylglycine-generating enzyme required for sulfatase activity
LPENCGISARDGCCSSPEIPGEAFYRSYDKAGDGNLGDLSFPATVSGFRLDKYEVTVGRFRAFVAAGMGTQVTPPIPGSGAHQNIPGSGWQSNWNASLLANAAALVTALGGFGCTWTDLPGANENRPVLCVTWYEAMAFCAWDGGYLPTEAEWNYAATGGVQQRAYPWSMPAGSLNIDNQHASYAASGDCVGDGMPGCTIADIFMVGTKPQGDGRWGQSELAGNVNEWNLDSFGTYEIPCTDCANLSETAMKVIRGGGYTSDAIYLRAGTRLNGNPMQRFNGVGFRCARSVASPAAAR